MLALFFEVRPREDGGWDRYLSIAALLRPLLAEQEGLLFIDRYRSLLHPGTLLSHSLWRDEAALAAWRANGVHSGAQSKGRQDVFDEYRLRVAHVLRTAISGGPAEPTAPRSTYRDPTARPARFMVVATAGAEISPSDVEPTDTFESINREGEHLWLFDAADETAARDLIGALSETGATARACEVERDYGMFDRAEAPQYYPPVARLGTRGDEASVGKFL